MAHSSDTSEPEVTAKGLGAPAGVIAIMVGGIHLQLQMGIPAITGTKNYCPELQNIVCPGHYWNLSAESILAFLAIALAAGLYVAAYQYILYE